MNSLAPTGAHDPAVPIGTALGAATAAGRGAVAAHRVRPRLGQVREQGLVLVDDRVIAAGGSVCCVWDQATREIVWRHAESETIACVAAGAGHVAVTTGKRLRVYRLHDGAFVFEAVGDAQAVSACVARKDRVAVSFADGRIELLDLPCGQHLMRTSHQRGQNHIFIDEDGELLLSQAANEVVLLLANSGRVIRRFSLTAPPTPTGFGRGRPMLAPHGTQVRIFDCGRENLEACRVVDFDSPVTSLDDVAAAGVFVVSTLDGGIHTVGLWGDRRSSVRCYTHPLYCVRAHRGALYAAGGEGLIHRIEGGVIRAAYADSPPLVCAALSPDKRTILLGDRLGSVAQLPLAAQPRCHQAHRHEGAVTALVCDDTRVASGGYDGVCNVGNWRGDALATVDVGRGPIQALALDPRTNAVWIGAHDGTLVAAEGPTLRPTLTLEGRGRSIRCIELSADGRQLLAGDDGGELCMRDLDAAGRVVDRWRLGDAVYRAAFDGDTVLACGECGVLRLRIGQARPVLVYPGTGTRMFARTADALYALSLDGQLRRFDIHSAAVVAQHRLRDPRPHRIVLALNENRILVAGGSAVATVFDASLRPLAELHHQGPRDGLLWLTLPQPEQRHPGWLHAERPEWLVVGEQHDGEFAPWPEDDPRRAAHLLLYDSLTHVLAAVTGAATSAPIAHAVAQLELRDSARRLLAHTRR